MLHCERQMSLFFNMPGKKYALKCYLAHCDGFQQAFGILLCAQMSEVLNGTKNVVKRACVCNYVYAIWLLFYFHSLRTAGDLTSLKHISWIYIQKLLCSDQINATAFVTRWKIRIEFWRMRRDSGTDRKVYRFKATYCRESSIFLIITSHTCPFFQQNKSQAAFRFMRRSSCQNRDD